MKLAGCRVAALTLSVWITVVYSKGHARRTDEGKRNQGAHRGAGANQSRERKEHNMAKFPRHKLVTLHSDESFEQLAEMAKSTKVLDEPPTALKSDSTLQVRDRAIKKDDD
jgi:hypothetical protein